MSTIRLLVINSNTLYSQECHYRAALRFLDGNDKTRIRFLRVIKTKRYLDQGYLLIDMDNETIISGQLCFPLGDMQKRKSDLKNWNIIEQL